MKRHPIVAALLMVVIFATLLGCAGDNPRMKKVAKPIDDTAEKIVKVREFKSQSGSTRAIVSPADERQLRIPF